MLVSNKKFKIILLLIVVLASALFAFTWHKSKIIFEQVVNEGLVSLRVGDKITYEVVEFSHSFFNHKAVIKNPKMEGENKLIDREGDIKISSNLLLNKVAFDVSGKTIIYSSADSKQILATISADKLIYNYKYYLTMGETFKLLFSGTDVHKKYAKYNFTFGSEVLQPDAKNDKLEPEAQEFTSLIESAGAEIVNLKVDSSEYGKLQLEKLHANGKIASANNPKVKYNLDFEFTKLDNNIDTDKFMADNFNIERPSSKHKGELWMDMLKFLSYDDMPLSAKYNGVYEIDYENFTANTKHDYSMLVEDIGEWKGKVEINGSYLDDKKQLALNMKWNDVGNAAPNCFEHESRYYIKTLKQLLERHDLTKGEYELFDHKLTKDEIAEIAKAIIFRTDAYKDVTFNFDAAAVLNLEQEREKFFDSVNIKDISLKMPAYKYGIGNVNFSHINNTPSITVDIIIEGYDAFFTDLKGYVTRVVKAVPFNKAQMPENVGSVGADVMKTIFIDLMATLSKNIADKVSNDVKDDKRVITISYKDGVAKIGNKELSAFEKMCREEMNKIIPSSK